MLPWVSTSLSALKGPPSAPAVPSNARLSPGPPPAPAQARTCSCCRKPSSDPVHADPPVLAPATPEPRSSQGGQRPVQTQAASSPPDVLPPSRGCERTPTCPAGPSVARLAERSLVSGLRADGLPDKSLLGHIPPSAPAALLLLVIYLHWCMCSV